MNHTMQISPEQAGDLKRGKQILIKPNMPKDWVDFDYNHNTSHLTVSVGNNKFKFWPVSSGVEVAFCLEHLAKNIRDSFLREENANNK